VERYLRYFVALGAGFFDGHRSTGNDAGRAAAEPEAGPVLIMGGYCVVHLLEHTINAHFHYGEETHTGEFVSQRTGYSVLAGLSVHALFDGVGDRLGICPARLARLADLSGDSAAQGAEGLPWHR